MPIYEFECSACGRVYDLLVLGSAEVEIKCPECGSPEAARRMSAASHSMGQPGASARGGVTGRTCGSGSCATLDIPGRYD